MLLFAKFHGKLQVAGFAGQRRANPRVVRVIISAMIGVEDPTRFAGSLALVSIIVSQWATSSENDPVSRALQRD
jgi:hypothetical protein